MHAIRNQLPWLSGVLLCLTVGTMGGCDQSKPAPRKKAMESSGIETPVADPNAPFRVTGVEIGKGVSPKKRIVEPTTIFQRYDVIYISVVTEGTGPEVVLKARWTFGGAEPELVHEAVRLISPTGPLATEFHITKQDGWVPGRYKAEVFIEGKSVGAVDYTVAK